MNEALQKKLVESIDDIQKFASTTVDFSKKEVPLAIREYLRYILWDEFLWTVVAIIFLAATAYFFRKWKNHKWGEYQDAEQAITFAGIIAIMTISFFGFVNGVSNIGKIAFAPRIVIMEKMAELTTGNCKHK